MQKALSVIAICMALIFGGQQTFAAEGDLQDAVDEVLGVPYKWGGTSSAGFDCSGFIIYIFKQYEIKLPRTSQTQAKEGVEVAKEDLKQGDLVFFNTSGKGISHAGIYLGGGKFAHSSSSKGVIVSKMSDSYYESRYVTARRVISST